MANHVDEAKNTDGSTNLAVMAAHAKVAIENILAGKVTLHDAIQHTLSDGKVARVFITSE